MLGNEDDAPPADALKATKGDLTRFLAHTGHHQVKPAIETRISNVVVSMGTSRRQDESVCEIFWVNHAGGAYGPNMHAEIRCDTSLANQG